MNLLNLLQFLQILVLISCVGNVEGMKNLFNLHQIKDKTPEGNEMKQLKRWADKMSEKSLAKFKEEFHAPNSKNNDNDNDNNPYSDVHLIDESHFLLSRFKYIFTKHITGVDKGIICTQGPKEENTIVHFWQMIVEHKVDAILMVTDMEKDGEEKKYVKYWPSINDKEFLFGKYKIKFAGQYRIVEVDFWRTELEIYDTEQPEPKKVVHQVTHFHWAGWPDHGAPKIVEEPLWILDTLKNKKYKNIVVHSSAEDFGRTGTILAIKFGVYLMQKDKALNIPELVAKLGKERFGMVQQVAQYLYIYNVFLSYAHRESKENKIKLTNENGVEQLIKDITEEINKETITEKEK